MRSRDASAALPPARGAGRPLTLCALRVLPRVLHSLCSYGADLLRLALPPFVAATAPGFAVKSFLYAAASGRVVDSASLSDLTRTGTLGEMRKLFAPPALVLISISPRLPSVAWKS